MKLNRIICPNCEHEFYTDELQTKCDACQCCFYASQSKTCRAQGQIMIQPAPQYVPPPIYIPMVLPSWPSNGIIYTTEQQPTGVLVTQMACSSTARDMGSWVTVQ